jgi:hypothetical protein
MTVQNPAWALASESQTPASFRRMTHFLHGVRGGVVAAGLAVSEKSGTPNMSVDVAEGAAIISGTESSGSQGAYFVENQGVQNVTISAAHATLARRDLIVAKVQDSQYSGATNAWSLVSVAGTPAASPLYPAVPANSIVLAVVAVGAAVSSITNANITDIRSGSATDGTTTLINRGYAAAIGGRIICTSTTRPSAPIEGQEIYESNTDRIYSWSGSAWVLTGGLGAGETWTPTVTQGVGVSVTVNRAAYTKMGRRVSGECHLTCTSSGTSSTDVSVTIPLPRAAAINHAIGTGYFIDSGTGNVFPVVAYLNGVSSMAFMRTAVDGTSAVYLGSSGLTQLTSGDTISISINYEASS